jgi:predicted DNA-binding protein (MmcQ/YjbR family)
MFAMLANDERGRLAGVWFKAGEESYEILTRLKGIRPCPYLARAKWVAVDGLTVLPAKILKAYLVRAHTQVAMGLSRKQRAALGILEKAPPMARA